MSQRNRRNDGRAAFPDTTTGSSDASNKAHFEAVAARVTREVREIDSIAPVVVPPREACRMLSVGMTRLYELLHEGQFESFRYGRSRRITVSSIHAYVRRQLATTGGTSWDPPP